MADLELWYDRPAEVWTEALPLGNGRLGAMVFGGIARERFQLNEETLWTGGPYSQANPEAFAHLPEVRDLILAGRHAEAEQLADRHLMGRPLRQMSFQPAGDLWLDLDLAEATTDYRRTLNLDTAIAETRFRAGHAGYLREAFVSPVEGVLVVRLAVRRGAIGLTVRLASPQQGTIGLPDARSLRFAGVNRGAEGVPGRLRFAVEARVTTDGTCRPQGETLRIEDALEVLILLDVATSFRRFDDVSADPLVALTERLDAADVRSAADLREAHVTEHRRLFRRFDIALGAPRAPDLPTDRRIAANADAPEPALAALFVHYARYLMISGSRPGTQPVTLQGLWNDLPDPPWGSKYTSNINLQMHYWLPDPANLAECVEPLVRMVEDLAETGAEVARLHYGARGWVLHHNTDLWRAAGPTDGARWGLWPTGGAWLCAQLWDHVEYGADDLLVARLYPLFAGAARFILDVLVPLPGSDLLVTVPSLSPENVHPRGASLCAGPAMDTQIIRDLFGAVLAAARRVGGDDQLLAEVRAALGRLPAHRIGRAGQLQEWLEDWDMEAPEIHHRHVSHLYGLYPGLQISRHTTPELAAAARRSLEIRGDEATGWGVGWRINLWARLGEGNHAEGVVNRLLSPDRTYPNLFDAHPPFQIDGNFGGAAGIVEMLVQSRPGRIDLLPALPDRWPQGRVRGVRLRGAVTADFTWSAGRLDSLALHPSRDASTVLAYDGETLELDLVAGREVRVERAGGRLVRL